jgi:putative hydrolase of the HAD superfamily
VLAPLESAVLAANTGRGRIPSEHVRRALVAARRRSFDEVAEEFRLPAPLRAAWADANAALEVSVPLAPYDDVEALAALSVPRFLVTTGFRRFQESKIAALGVARLFDAVHVDALDSPHREGKRAIFSRIAVEWGLTPDQVLVVGDSAESELRAGRELGMVTVQVLRDGVEACTWADYRIESLHDLAGVAAAAISR